MMVLHVRRRRRRRRRRKAYPGRKKRKIEPCADMPKTNNRHKPATT
jgi:hypothetical protein